MPGFVLHAEATVLCQHAGKAQPATPLPRVRVAGQPAAGQAAPYAVTGCSLASSGSPPCATAQWTVAATRVSSTGIALVLQDSTAVCVPTGTGLFPIVVQTRVRGT